MLCHPHDTPTFKTIDSIFSVPVLSMYINTHTCIHTYPHESDDSNNTTENVPPVQVKHN